MSARDAALSPLREEVRAGVEAICKRVGHVAFALACGVAPLTLRVALEGKPIKAVTHGAIERGLLTMNEPAKTSTDAKLSETPPGPGTVDEQRERSYLEGRRRAYIDTIMRSAEALGYGTSRAKMGALIAEIQEAKQKLRDLCERHGDNGWDESLYLADVIEKHLGRYLDAKREDDRQLGAATLVEAHILPTVPERPTNKATVTSCDGCPFAFPPLTLDDRYCGLDTAITWRPSQTEARIPPPACPLRREHVLVRLGQFGT